MKKYAVRIPPDVESFLRHLHPRIKVKIRRALEELECDPWLGKPLKGRLQGLYTYRVSHYRIIYQIDSRNILVQVVDVDDRKIIYKKVEALL